MSDDLKDRFFVSSCDEVIGNYLKFLAYSSQKIESNNALMELKLEVSRLRIENKRLVVRGEKLRVSNKRLNMKTERLALSVDMLEADLVREKNKNISDDKNAQKRKRKPAKQECKVGRNSDNSKNIKNKNKNALKRDNKGRFKKR